MEIILLERVEKLGQMGDVVKVKPGYARNFLRPQGKALRSNKANLERFDTEKAQREADNLSRRSDAEKEAGKLDGLAVNMVRAASEMGQLFGSVTSRDIANAVTEGTLDMVATACVGIASCSRLSPEMRAMARKQITGIGAARRVATNQETELDRFMSLREQARAIEEDENAAKLFGMGAEASKGHKTGFNVTPFVAPAFSWGDPDAEESEEKSEIELMREEMQAMSTKISELKQAPSQGNQRVNQINTKGKSKSQQERDEKYWNDPVNKAIKDNNFKDGEHDPDIQCDICGGPHRRIHCGRLRVDKYHNQLRAHCNGRCIAFYKSRGYPHDRPAEGTYKPYPHGPRCFGDVDPPPPPPPRESKAPEKSARELELEREVAELKKTQGKKETSLSAEDDAESGARHVPEGASSGGDRAPRPQRCSAGPCS